MPAIGKRRAGQEPPSSPPPTRRRRSPDSQSGVSDAPNLDGSENGADEADSQDQVVKKLVRLALSSEYSRVPLRRAEITSKVIGSSGGKISFRTLLTTTNDVLTRTFGMRLTELPARTHNTIAQKRAAAANSQAAATQPSTQSQKSGSTSQGTYVLTSTLPAAYRSPAILAPPACPTTSDESAYASLYTMIISLILLSPGQTLAEGRLMRHLARMNIEDYWTSGEKIDTVLKRMERQNYIIKVRERDGGGEEAVDYVVGPRGKVEVGEKGAAGLVRGVYCGGAANDVSKDEVDRRLVRSLGDAVLQKTRRSEDRQDEARQYREEPDGSNGNIDNSQRSRRRRANELVDDQANGDEDDGEEEDEEEDED